MFRVVVVAALLASSVAAADTHQCENIHVHVVPTDSLQLVAWIETAGGQYVDTIFITNKTGIYGLGNRPGRFDFNSGPVPDPTHGIDDMWPYGRRITTFPVWAKRHGVHFPLVVFQNDREDDLSHPSGQSSREGVPPYCRPIDPDADPASCFCNDQQLWDTGTCATGAFTDKGKFSTDGATSDYPPRADLMRTSFDAPSVAMFAALDVFDTVTHATPAGGVLADLSYSTANIAPGDYVMFVEASKAFDFNATYNPSTYPEPTGIGYQTYGSPYRGQPSVVYSVPFTVGAQESITSTQDFLGYGDPNGLDGMIRAPDGSITTDTPGSGASRLELVSIGGEMYRVRVDAVQIPDFVAPDPPSELVASQVQTTSAAFRFIAPGDDGQVGAVTAYEVRFRASEPITEDNFDSSTPTGVTIPPNSPGGSQVFNIAGLLPETDYWVGVRAYDDCRNPSTLAVVQVRTADRTSGEVSACFIATAAYGSVMANDVETLRAFRDTVLHTTVFGELAIEGYYTFGPSVASVVGSSELLRTTARDALQPIVAWIRALHAGHVTQ